MANKKWVSAQQRLQVTVAVLMMLVCGATWAAQTIRVHSAPRHVRVLVKVRAALAQDIESALPMSNMTLVPGQAASALVQTFMTRHTPRKVAPMYPELVRTKKVRGLTNRQVADETRRRFPHRAQRLRAAFQPPEIARTYVLEMDLSSRQNLRQILNDLKADPNVEFAEEEKVISVNFAPNDTYFLSAGSWGQSYDDLWGIKKIGAPPAWDTTAGTGVIIAVVDTGIDYNHLDIASNIWTNANEIAGNGVDDDGNGYADDVRGWDFVGPDYRNPTQGNDPIDHNGHGTHVAGTIAAVGNNGIGVIGVAWQSKVMIVKGLDDSGTGLESTLANSIFYAAHNGADVISNSWAGQGTSQTIADAVDYAYNLGAVVVAAAGNNADDARNYFPANLPEVITVAATAPDDSIAAFSNFGSKIDVAAPGVDILSLRAAGTSLGSPINNDYTRADGTSMAAPHVSGAAALLLSEHPEYSNEDVRQAVRTSATDLGTPGYDLSYGYGRMNASAALAVSGVLEAKIDSPADGVVTQGPLTISGIARGNGFSYYTLEFGSGKLPNTWTTFQTSTIPSSGTLGVFDPGFLADGVYEIRLTAHNTSAQVFTDRIQVVVRTVSIVSPVLPRAPTSSTTFKNGIVIPIVGTAVGASFQQFQVDWSPGLDPNSGWQSTGVTLTGGGSSPVTNGLLANWDTSSIGGAGYFTIRLTATNAATSSQALTMVYLEPDLLSANWPQLLDQGPYFSAGVVPAVNADRSIRLVLEGPAEGSSAGEFWKLPPNAAPLQTLLPGLGSFQQPSVADLDGSPGEEAVVADTVGIEVFREDNTSYPLTTDSTLYYALSQIVVEDLAGDSHWETLALGTDYNTQLAYVSAWRPDGQLLNNNFPIQIADQNPVNSYYNRARLLVGDVDGDGKKEILVQEGLSASTFTLRLFANDGSPRAWQVPVLDGIPQAMVAADLDHNGKLETILVHYSGDSGSQAVMHVFQPDGTERSGWPLTLPNANQYSQSYLAVGDLNRDGQEEIVYSHESYLYVFKGDGTTFSSAWPLQTGSIGYAGVVIGDVDGDGFPEIVTTLNSIESTPDPFFIFGGRYYDEKLLALRRDATIAKSWQLTGRDGYDLYAYPAPAIGDFNQDGIADIAVAYEVTGSPSSVPGVVSIVSTGAKFNAALNDWPMVRHDPRNTGVLGSMSVSSSTTTVISSGNPSFFAQNLTFTATVAVESNFQGANIPTGQVTFLDGSATLGSCSLSSGSCAFATSSLAAGTHSITGSYGGDKNFVLSTSSTLTQVVNANSNTTLSSTPNPSLVGQPVTLTGTVVAIAPATGTPTGAVTFYDNMVSIGSATLNSAGRAALTISNLPQGMHSLSATYGGDSTFSASTTLGPTTQVVVGTPAGSFSKTLLSFGSQRVSVSSAPKTVTLTSAGTATLSISGFSVTGDFSQTNNCGNSLPPGQTCTVNVFFTPIARGTRNGTLTLNSNASGPAPKVALSGTGIGPLASVSPGSLSFAAQAVNTASPSKSLVLSNTGDATLHIAAISASGDFTPTNTCGASLGAGAKCNVYVIFKPSVYGSRTGALAIADDAVGGTTQTVTLSGTGLDYALSASPSSVTVASGKSAAYTVTAQALGGTFASPIPLSCSGQPAASSCSFSPASVKPGSTSATSHLTISTTVRHLQSGTPAGTYTITIKGTSSTQHSTTVMLTVN